MFSKLQLELSKEQEDSYRQLHLRADVKQAKLGILFFAIPLVCFIFNDYQLFGLSSQFYGVAALRFGILVYTILEFAQIGKVKRYKTYDRSITAYSLVLMVCSGIINATRPQNFIVHVIITVMAVFVIYLITPNRFINQIIIASTTTIGEAVVIMLFQQPSSIPVFFTILLSLLLANIIAVSSSWQLQTYRRKSFQDLTKSKALQAELEKHTVQLEALVAERTEKLKSVERLAAIGETAGMVGHDIRNPLTSITGAVHILRKRLKKMPDGEDKDVMRENLDLIANQTIYVNKIVEDLQDFARPMHPRMEEIDLEQMVQSTLSELNIPDKITVENLLEKQNPKLKTDPVYMQRILTNLINNAVQAMPEGGKLTLKVHREENDAVITFQDTGVGIPEEAKTRLFTPLFTTKSKGQGFGLAVVKRMTEALKGTVTFESEEGKGAKFIIRLPQENKK